MTPLYDDIVRTVGLQFCILGVLANGIVELANFWNQTAEKALSVFYKIDSEIWREKGWPSLHEQIQRGIMALNKQQIKPVFNFFIL
jgi:hypothetical protein